MDTLLAVIVVVLLAWCYGKLAGIESVLKEIRDALLADTQETEAIRKAKETR